MGILNGINGGGDRVRLSEEVKVLSFQFISIYFIILYIYINDVTPCDLCVIGWLKKNIHLFQIILAQAVVKLAKLKLNLADIKINFQIVFLISLNLVLCLPINGILVLPI